MTKVTYCRDRAQLCIRLDVDHECHSKQTFVFLGMLLLSLSDRRLREIGESITKALSNPPVASSRQSTSA